MVQKFSRLSNLPFLISIFYFCQNIFDNDFQGVLILKLKCQYILPFYSLCFVSFLSVIVNMKSCIQIAQLWYNFVVLNKRLYDAWLMHIKLDPLCCKRGSNNVVNNVISDMSS